MSWRESYEPNHFEISRGASEHRTVAVLAGIGRPGGVWVEARGVVSQTPLVQTGFLNINASSPDDRIDGPGCTAVTVLGYLKQTATEDRPRPLSKSYDLTDEDFVIEDEWHTVVSLSGRTPAAGASGNISVAIGEPATSGQARISAGEAVSSRSNLVSPLGHQTQVTVMKALVVPPEAASQRTTGVRLRVVPLWPQTRPAYYVYEERAIIPPGHWIVLEVYSANGAAHVHATAEIRITRDTEVGSYHGLLGHIAPVEL